MSIPRSQISRNPPPVRTKRDFICRYLRGEFGNMPPTWTTLEDFEKSDYSGPICFRSTQAAGEFYPGIPPSIALGMWKSFPVGSYYANVMAPDDKLTFQGEVIQGVKGLDLLFSYEKLPLRVALNQLGTERVQGAVALLLLQYYLNPKSMDWLNHLLDCYPEHAIEFSCYSCCWGTLEGFNTIFWEIRKY